MADFPKGIDQAELMGILAGGRGETKTPKHYRLSAEALRILELEAEHYDVDATKALELILREHRERVQKRRKRGG